MPLWKKCANRSLLQHWTSISRFGSGRKICHTEYNSKVFLQKYFHVEQTSVMHKMFFKNYEIFMVINLEDAGHSERATTKLQGNQFTTENQRET